MENVRLKKENVQLENKSFHSFEFIGENSQIAKIKKLTIKLSSADSRILIYGPTGSGKELLARKIHKNSQRSKEPFVILNGALLQPDNYETELFGSDNPDGTTTTLTSYIQSYNFSLQADQTEVFLAMRRFIPNFKVLTTSNKVTIKLKDYPSDTLANSDYSPFTILPTTQKVDTRARGRYAGLRIENDGAAENWRFGTFQVDLQPDGRR